MTPTPVGALLIRGPKRRDGPAAASTARRRRERSELVPLVLFPSSFWPPKKGTATINEQRSNRCTPTVCKDRDQWILELDIAPSFLNFKTVW